MSTTVADYLLCTGCASGVSSTSSASPGTASTACSPPGRRRRDPAAVRPGPARGDGRLRGLRLRQVHRPGRRLHRRPAGPGAIHLLNGLYDAKLDHVPVRRDRRPDRPLARWAAPTSRRSTCSACQGRRRRVLPDGHRARAAAQRPRPGDPDRLASQRTVTAVIIPSDVQELEYTPPGARLQDGPLQPRPDLRPPGPAPTPTCSAPPTSSTPARRSPCSSARAPAAPRRGRARSPTSSAPASAKALLGKDVLSDELPWVTGSIGLLGTRPELRADDGLRHPARRSAPTSPTPSSCRRSDQARRASRSTSTRPWSACATPSRSTSSATPPPTLRALLPLLSARRDRAWRDTIEENVARWWEVDGRTQAMVDADPINPEQVFAELSDAAARRRHARRRLRLAANWYARHVKIRGDHAGHAVGHPGHHGLRRPVRHRRQVRPPRPARPRPGRRRGDADERHGRADHHRQVLAATGPTRGWSCRCCTTTTSTRSPGRCGRWRASPQFPRLPEPARRRLRRLRPQPRAARHRRRRPRRRRPAPGTRRWPPTGPTVLDVRTDPAVPPIPPHATFDQMKEPTSRSLRGDERPLGRHQGGHQDQAAGVPARTEGLTRTGVTRQPIEPSSRPRRRRLHVPTDHPRPTAPSPGTPPRWSLVQATRRRRQTGIGWTYAAAAAAAVVRDMLAASSCGRDALDVAGAWSAMHAALRNIGRPGIAGRAPCRRSTSRCGTSRPGCSACRCTGCSGAARDDRPGLRQRRVHHLRRRRSSPSSSTDGSTTGHPARQDQDRRGLGHPTTAATSTGSARPATSIGDDVELFVDANGGYTVKQAVRHAAAARRPRRHLVRGAGQLRRPDGLRAGARRRASRRRRRRVRLRPRLLPAACAPPAPSTACRSTSPAAAAHRVAAHRRRRRRAPPRVSGHCAPDLHAPVAAPRPNLRHLEWFHDHVRIEQLLFDGAPSPQGGAVHSRPVRAGHGITLAPSAEDYRTR